MSTSYMFTSDAQVSRWESVLQKGREDEEQERGIKQTVMNDGIRTQVGFCSLQGTTVGKLGLRKERNRQFSVDWHPQL